MHHVFNISFYCSATVQPWVHISTRWKSDQLQVLVKPKIVVNACVTWRFAPLDFLSKAQNLQGWGQAPAEPSFSMGFLGQLLSTPLLQPRVVFLHNDCPFTKESKIVWNLGLSKVQTNFIKKGIPWHFHLYSKVTYTFSVFEIQWLGEVHTHQHTAGSKSTGVKR